MTAQNASFAKRRGEYRREPSDRLVTQTQRDGYIDLDLVRCQMTDSAKRPLITVRTA